MAGYATPTWTNNAAPAIDATAMTNMGQGIEIAEHPYGVCSTASGTAAKTVTIDFSGTLTLFAGLTVRVKFTNGNTAANPTLNVNGTGAIAVFYGNSLRAGSGWTAGSVMSFLYDGTNWITSQANAVDTTPNASHTSNLITSAAVAGVQSDIASININGTTNNTGSTIPQGTFFYISGTLVTAKTDIANGATLTSGTNYETVTAGGLNALIAQIMPFKRIGTWSNGTAIISLPKGYGARLMVFASASSDRNAFLIAQSDGSGVVGLSTVFKANAITFATGNGTITATVASGNPVSVSEMPLQLNRYSTFSVQT